MKKIKWENQKSSVKTVRKVFVVNMAWLLVISVATAKNKLYIDIYITYICSDFYSNTRIRVFYDIFLNVDHCFTTFLWGSIVVLWHLNNNTEISSSFYFYYFQNLDSFIHKITASGFEKLYFQYVTVVIYLVWWGHQTKCFTWLEIPFWAKTKIL